MSLLEDDDFIAGVKEYIHLSLNQSGGFDPSMKWEFLKCQIRSYCITYSIKKNKERTKVEKKLEKDLDILENEYHKQPSSSLLKIIKDKEDMMTQLYEQKIKGAMFRSKVKWIEEGEKPTKYFFDLEKRNFNKKTISSLTSENGIITNQNQILNEIYIFYKNMYVSSNPPPVEQDNIFFPLDYESKASRDDFQNCEGLISVDECYTGLREMKNGKSPGCDGFPSEFYMHFWNEIGQVLVDSLNHGFGNGCLSDSQRRGLISLIPKPHKDLLDLNNWRPISLLNVDYKLISKCLTNRLKTVLPKLIHNDQTGFLKDRFIGENIRLVLDLINFTDLNNIPGHLLLIDFKSAFDKLEWNFIWKTLEYFNFGPQFIK